MVGNVKMPYSKDKYVIRQQLQKIRNLEAEIERLKKSNKMVIVEKSAKFSWLSEHYVTVWRKGDHIKIKVNITPNYKDLYYVDNYGWQLVYYYIQVSFYPLDFRYFYIIDL